MHQGVTTLLARWRSAATYWNKGLAPDFSHPTIEYTLFISERRSQPQEVKN